MIILYYSFYFGSHEDIIWFWQIASMDISYSIQWMKTYTGWLKLDQWRGFCEDNDCHLAKIRVIIKLLEFVWSLILLKISWWYTENTIKDKDIKSNWVCLGRFPVTLREEKTYLYKLDCLWSFLLLYILADNDEKRYLLAPNSIDVV